jgi:dTDP-4-dehydrorhamnose reductase
VIREVQPDLIVNPAAYTAVDKAESEPELAMAVNGTAPGVIAEEAKLLGAGSHSLFHRTMCLTVISQRLTTEQDEPDPTKHLRQNKTSW